MFVNISDVLNVRNFSDVCDRSKDYKLYAEKN
jgi:hypothetical protein